MRARALNDLDIQRLRDLARSNDLLPLDRQLLRDAANAIERTLNPVPLQSRSEFRAILKVDGGTYCGSVCDSRKVAATQVRDRAVGNSRDLANGHLRMEYRTVVESDWRPTHV